MNCKLIIDPKDGLIKCSKNCGNIYPRRPGIAYPTDPNRIYWRCQLSDNNFTVARPSKAKIMNGPGTELHKLINRYLKEEITPFCKCYARMLEMNSWGPTKCREKIETIIDWLVEEGNNRKRKIVNMPGARWGIEKLVLLAIRRTEKHEKGS